MKLVSSLLLAGALSLAATPVVTAQHNSSSPYHTRFAVDAPVILGLGAVNAFGLYRVQQKNGLNEAELAALNRNDVPKFDRFVAGNYSEKAQTASDIFCYGSLAAAPGLLALNPDIRGKYGQVMVLYLETMATSSAIFTSTVGNVYRYRPFLYGSEGTDRERSSKISTNSFFAGHTAHTATATFFAAKVFHDFNPNSPAQPYVWGAAAVVPAVVAYYRMEAGKHFLSDNLVGYAVGATVGVLVPQLHKTTSGRGLSVTPLQGVNVNGYSYGGLRLTKQL
ncbi:phosphatase PAP2 family protein [Hymenobacter cellulosivorans]|uniref:Phosphatase PAP2 family protein n=1 Tax=Hymenobacter cellulosivorans TaxID=2932249 RepID=A0ABY4F2W4_9BACT|nr:phosphatase PAP2 family protein [Hymenobacter cellulosivorans]UOQ50895.1 phosphatase PAP2 family protein [Hymenobacter cellulosivorans]